MKNKYYTPTIEEFHVGFEYEYLESEKWEKETITEGSLSSGDCGADHYVENDFNHIRNLLPKDKIRVKHLDREDIESLGWKDIEDNFFELFNNGLIHKILLVNGNVWIYFKQNIGNEKIVDKTLFFGKIKNKSELQKLMIQLNIK